MELYCTLDVDDDFHTIVFLELLDVPNVDFSRDLSIELGIIEGIIFLILLGLHFIYNA